MLLLPVPGPGVSQTALWVVGNATAHARGLSIGAVPGVLDLVANVSSSLGMSAVEMVRRFAEEVETVEVVANWEAVANSSILDTVVGLEVLEENPYLPNLYEMRYGDPNLDCDCPTALAQENLLGFPAWPLDRHCCPRNFTFEEASERPTYAALNTLRIDAGAFMFGDAGFAFRRRSGATIVCPGDSGAYELFCRILKVTKKFDCSAKWPAIGEYGTLDDYLHLVPFAQAHNEDVDWVQTHFPRLLENEWGATEIDFAAAFSYWEVLMLRPAFFDDAVLFVLANFTSLYGNENEGSRVRAWCVEYGKVLVWARAAGPSYNGRFLDPVVLRQIGGGGGGGIGANVTDAVATEAALALVEATWEEAAAEDNNNRTQHDVLWERLATGLPVEALQEPLRYGKCGKPDSCVGTDPLGNCVCYIVT